MLWVVPGICLVKENIDIVLFGGNVNRPVFSDLILKLDTDHAWGVISTTCILEVALMVVLGKRDNSSDFWSFFYFFFSILVITFKKLSCLALIIKIVYHICLCNKDQTADTRELGDVEINIPDILNWLRWDKNQPHQRY